MPELSHKSQSDFKKPEPNIDVQFEKGNTLKHGLEDDMKRRTVAIHWKIGH